MIRLSVLFLIITSAIRAQTLEQFLSFPKESNLVASADGKIMAWVINDKGVRNIITKSGVDQPKMFTDYQHDDGEEISQLVFSANGTKLAFVKGKFIYYKGLTSQFSPLKITEGINPVFYPDGLKLLFVKQGQLFETNLEINPEIKSLGVNEIISDLKFSPSGNEILFAGAGVGIYNWSLKQTKWINKEKGVSHPCWSADGKQIAFFKKQEAAKTISLCVADATTLAVKEIGSSSAVDGFFAKGISKPIYWTSTNRILFYAENTGWRHIYSVKPDGTDLRDVTPGENEADNFTIDSFGQNIYYATNKDDSERRHIWKTNLTVENVVQLTKVPGIETDPMMVGPFLYCFKSTANTPSALNRIDEIRKTTTAIITPKQAAPTYFVKPEAVIVPSGSESLSGQLFIDRMLNGKRIPLVFIHGSEEQMMTGFHNKDMYSDFYAFHQYLASIGYAVIAINYRGSTGHGRDFRLSDLSKQNQDVLAAAKFLQLLPEVDKSKVGVFGLDYGGYLTEMALTNNSTVFKAGINIQSDNDKATNQTNADVSKYASPFLLIENETMGSHDSRLKIFKNVQDFFDKKLKQ